MKRTWATKHCNCTVLILCVLFALPLLSRAQPVTIDFEDFPAAMPLSLYPVPADSRLSNQLALVHGVIFSSESRLTTPLDDQGISRGVMMMEASSVRRLAKECWLRLGTWPRRILTILAVLVGVVWVAIRIPRTDRSC